MDFSRKLYVHIGLFPFKQEVFLKYELFLDSAIKIRFRRIVPDKGGSTPGIASKEKGDTSSKKKKVKERTIKQAREYVYYWRNLY